MILRLIIRMVFVASCLGQASPPHYLCVADNLRTSGGCNALGVVAARLLSPSYQANPSPAESVPYGACFCPVHAARVVTCTSANSALMCGRLELAFESRGLCFKIQTPARSAHAGGVAGQAYLSAACQCTAKKKPLASKCFSLFLVAECQKNQEHRGQLVYGASSKEHRIAQLQLQFCLRRGSKPAFTPT